MFTKKDRALLYNSKECIDNLNKSYFDDNAYLREQYNNMLKRANKAERDNVELRTKLNIYENYIQTSFLNKNTNMLGVVIMVNGELYELTSGTIYEEVGNPKTMSADFICIERPVKKFNEPKKEN